MRYFCLEFIKLLYLGWDGDKGKLPTTAKVKGMHRKNIF